MSCPVVKLLSDIDGEVVISCDMEIDHPFMHHDGIHNVYWPNEGRVREPIEVYHKKYVYEGLPVPATIGA